MGLLQAQLQPRASRVKRPFSVPDGLVLAQIVSDLMDGGLLIDVGCGSGLVGIEVALRRPDVKVLAIDVKRKLCDQAAGLAQAVEVLGRVQVVHGDALRIPLPHAAAICSNPPMLPGETGFLYREGAEYLPLWLALLRRLAKSNSTAEVYLHLFDFHGIYCRTGGWPSLQEAASGAGFRCIPTYRSLRTEGPRSQVRRKLAEASRFFPLGQVRVDGRLFDLASAAAVLAKWPEAFMEVPHSVCLLRR